MKQRYEINMKALKLAIISVFTLIVLFITVGLFLPKTFHVERQVTIKADSQTVFNYIVDLKQWKAWGTWFERDPNMQVTYTGPEKQPGMKSSWVSETEGNGEMTIIDINPGTKMTYSLYFPDFDMGSTGELTVSEKEGKTLVTWSNHGELDSSPINGWFAMLMDSMIGPDFEAGLANLKVLSEN